MENKINKIKAHRISNVTHYNYKNTVDETDAA